MRHRVWNIILHSYFHFIATTAYTGSLKRNNTIRFTSYLSKTWKLSFRLKPLGVSPNSWYTNILQIISKKNLAIVELWFYHQSTKTGICFNASVWKCYFSQTSLPLFKFSTFTVQQIQIGKQYRVQYFINGKKEYDAINRQPRAFRDVTFYASGPRWYEANATISDFKIDNNYGGN